MQFTIPLSALEETSIEDILSKLDDREFRMLMQRLGKGGWAKDKDREASQVARDMNFTLDTTLILVIS